MYHICFCANENYIKFTAAIMNNIIDKTGGGGYEKKPYIFHILTDKKENQSEQKLNELEKNLNLKYPCKIQIHTMSDEDFQGKGKWKGSSVANFILKFDEVLSDEVDKALCLDVDMFVFTDLRELFELDLKDKIAAAAYCYDNSDGYFNSGLVLFNVKEYKRLNLRKQALDYLIKHNPKYPDQDTLNAIIKKDKRLVLSPIWNFRPHNKNLTPDYFKDESEYPKFFLTRKEHQNLLKEVKIAHFLNCPKPWISKFTLMDGKICLSLFRDFWWDNALKTPVFKEELLKLYQNLKEKEIEELAFALELSSYDILILFKNQIEYKLGATMIKYSKSKQSYLKLSFTLAKIAIKYKIAKIIYEILSFYNPKFRSDDVEQILQRYENYPEILKAKEHLSYKFGVAFIKATKTWYKGGLIKFYFEAKALEREFKNKKAK